MDSENLSISSGEVKYLSHGSLLTVCGDHLLRLVRLSFPMYDIIAPSHVIRLTDSAGMTDYVYSIKVRVIDEPIPFCPAWLRRLVQRPSYSKVLSFTGGGLLLVYDKKFIPVAEKAISDIASVISEERLNRLGICYKLVNVRRYLDMGSRDGT